MAKAIQAGIAMIGAACAMSPAPASARQHQARIVAEARIGMINARAPRMGPKLVRRGGYTAITDMVRPRFVGGMIDIYPGGRSGFRLSVGNRYFSKTNFWGAAEQATRGLLYEPRMTRGGIGLQRSFRRWTPAITAGYDMEIVPWLVVGVEGGALKGRAINPGPRGRTFRYGDRKADEAGLNPVATLSLRYAF